MTDKELAYDIVFDIRSPPQSSFGSRIRVNLTGPNDPIDLDEIAMFGYQRLGFKTPQEALDYMQVVNRGYLSGDTERWEPNKEDFGRLAIYLSCVGIGPRNKISRDLEDKFEEFKPYNSRQ